MNLVWNFHVVWISARVEFRVSLRCSLIEPLGEYMVVWLNNHLDLVDGVESY